MYLTQSLHRALRAAPERIATIFQGRRHTYRTFIDRVARLAGAILATGIAPGDRVAILAMNSDRYLEVVMASFWGGAAVMPINTRWSDAEISHALADCAPSILVVDEHFVARLPAILAQAASVRHVLYAGEGNAPAEARSIEQLIKECAPVKDALRSGAQLAMVLYTGGTTGLPKGVMLSHANLCAAALGMAAAGCSTADIFLHAAPMFHMADLQLAFCHFLHAGTHAFIPGFSPGGVADAIERDRVTDVVLVPTMLRLLLDQPGLAQRDLSSLRTIFYGAAPITDALLEQAMAALPTTDFVQGYGMTETALTVMLPARYHKPGPHGRAVRKAAGLVTPAAELKVVDQDGMECAWGQPGELVVRGPSVMSGYWNRPDETNMAVVDGWMHTGDFGYMEENGFVYVVDRIKDMIITGGENVYSCEVENCLVTHPGVAQCAVIGIADDKWGEAVHAVVVLKAGALVSAGELQMHCRAQIAAYKCPRSVEFRSALPVSSTGKLLKAQLRAAYQGSARK
ncbi:fatty-acid--CoA ligase [Janthinobacterium sp. PC23-8]|nr:long-chain-fatty-acid--CoA ligase [Janthinobacterium sp. PC23-8]OYO26746.1 fatty-acid--CoA ligase [Janthinobacterium sp. PC23-8]